MRIIAGFGAGGGILDVRSGRLPPDGRCKERQENQQPEARSESVHGETLSVSASQKMSLDWKRSVMRGPGDTGLEVRCAGIKRQG